MARVTIALLMGILLGGCVPESRYAASPLAAAARAGDVGELDRLIDAGADINEGSGVNNWPPIIHAIHKHQLAALERLLERGAALDPQTRTRALNVARGSGDEPEVERVLAQTGSRAAASRLP